MTFIESYTTFDLLGNYDRQNNPQGLSVRQLLPLGIAWSSGGQNYKADHAEGVISKVLENRAGIALVIAPFEKTSNRAFVLKSNGTMMWDVGHKASGITASCIFTDVYYVSGELCFFLHLDGQDYKFVFDPLTGEIGPLLVSY